MPKEHPAVRISQRLRFRDLRVFLAVMECRSMGKAAARLGVTQPAVSEAISGLEETIGVRLFDRTSIGVDPTIYARALLKRGVAAFDELQQGLRDIEFLLNPSVGEVRIGSPDSIIAAILPRMIGEFCREFPGIALHFDQMPTPTLQLPDLLERRLDAVIAWISISEEHYGDDVAVEVLFEDEVIIAAGKHNRWAGRRRVNLQDLADEPWVGTPPTTLTTILLHQAFRLLNLPPPKLEVTTFSVELRHHLLTTAGFITAMPKSLQRLYPLLKALPVNLPEQKFPVAIVTVKNRTLSPVAELFLDRLRKFIKSERVN